MSDELQPCKAEPRSKYMIKDQKLNNLASGSRFWKNPVVPVWSLFINEYSHLFFEIDSDFATSRRDFIENMDTHVPTCLCGRFLHQLFHHVDTGADNTLTGTLPMGKQAMLHGIVRRRVGWIMRHPYFQASLLRKSFEFRFEEVGACTRASTPSTPEQERAGVRIVCLTLCMPPLTPAVTRKFTGIGACPPVDRPMILLQIIKAMWDDPPWRQTWEVMVKRFHDPVCVQRAGTVQMTDQLFCFVSLRRIGLGRPA
jgi:hypothetical protein